MVVSEGSRPHTRYGYGDFLREDRDYDVVLGSPSRSCMRTRSGRRFADKSFDLAVSEYGAAIWCDPFVWIQEAARILRPGGTLVFLGNSYLSMLTMPDEEAPASVRCAGSGAPLNDGRRPPWPPLLLCCEV